MIENNFALAFVGTFGKDADDDRGWGLVKIDAGFHNLIRLPKGVRKKNGNHSTGLVKLTNHYFFGLTNK